MKKIISLVLALILGLSALSALAEVITISPDSLTKFGTSGEEAYTETPGVTIIKPVTEEAKELVSEIVEGGDIVGEIYEKTTFVGEGAEEMKKILEEKDLTCIVLIPMPTIEIDESEVVDEYGEILTPIPVAIAEYLLQNEGNIKALFTYKKTAEDGTVELFTYDVKFEVRANGAGYVIAYQIPILVLQDAEGWPSFIDFELLTDKE